MTSVAIIGTGLIGGSIGLAVKRAHPDARVVVWDRDPDTAARAVERGAADEVSPDAAGAAAGVDVVFVATPVSVIAETIRASAESARAGTIFTDVGSTKSRLVLEIEGSLPDGVHFIGGHPMAGTEDQGIDAASASLFDGAWWVLTPSDGTDHDSYRRLHGLLTALGARIMALNADEHDALMAVVSHVPQLTATALMNLAAERGKDHAGLLALAAGGFRDVTRVAASNPEIWVDICRENRDAIAAALEGFSERLLQLRDLVVDPDPAGLRDALERARMARRSLPGKDLEGDPYDVRMPVPDRPGVLAEVTRTVGNLGVNIEDLQLTHSTEGGRGTLHLTIVGEGPAERVVEALTARGFEPRATRL